jgi:hypothetical protein
MDPAWALLKFNLERILNSVVKVLAEAGQASASSSTTDFDLANLAVAHST